MYLLSLSPSLKKDFLVFSSAPIFELINILGHQGVIYTACPRLGLPGHNKKTLPPSPKNFPSSHIIKKLSSLAAAEYCATLATPGCFPPEAREGGDKFRRHFPQKERGKLVCIYRPFFRRFQVPLGIASIFVSASRETLYWMRSKDETGMLGKNLVFHRLLSDAGARG